MYHFTLFVHMQIKWKIMWKKKFVSLFAMYYEITWFHFIHVNISSNSLWKIKISAFQEWMAGKSGRLTLSNIDQTSERGDGMVRRNTLKHYHVLDNSRMALLYKFSPDVEHDDEDDTYGNTCIWVYKKII